MADAVGAVPSLSASGPPGVVCSLCASGLPICLMGADGSEASARLADAVILLASWTDSGCAVAGLQMDFLLADERSSAGEDGYLFIFDVGSGRWWGGTGWRCCSCAS